MEGFKSDVWWFEALRFDVWEAWGLISEIWDIWGLSFEIWGISDLRSKISDVKYLKYQISKISEISSIYITPQISKISDTKLSPRLSGHPAGRGGAPGPEPQRQHQPGPRGPARETGPPGTSLSGPGPNTRTRCLRSDIWDLTFIYLSIYLFIKKGHLRSEVWNTWGLNFETWEISNMGKPGIWDVRSERSQI